MQPMCRSRISSDSSVADANARAPMPIPPRGVTWHRSSWGQGQPIVGAGADRDRLDYYAFWPIGRATRYGLVSRVSRWFPAMEKVAGTADKIHSWREIRGHGTRHSRRGPRGSNLVPPVASRANSRARSRTRIGWRIVCAVCPVFPSGTGSSNPYSLHRRVWADRSAGGASENAVGVE